MKRRTTKIILFSVSLFFLVAESLLSYGIYSFMSKPLFGEEPDDKPDDVLVTNFNTHRAEFERIKLMSVEDRTMTRVDDNWTQPLTLDPVRLAEYRRLFRIMGTPRGITADLDRNQIQLMSTSHGWAVSGSSKGYVYFKEKPKLKEGWIKLVESLDGYGWHNNRDTFVIRHIEGNWYLYFERS